MGGSFHMRHLAFAAGALLCAAAGATETSEPIPARASLAVENDMWGRPRSDDNYTMGVAASRHLPALPSDPILRSSFDLLERIDTSVFGLRPAKLASATWTFASTNFTPKDITDRAPQYNDRPYASLFYYGVGYAKEIDDVVRESGFEIGVLGTGIGKSVQTGIHRLCCRDRLPSGWDNQIGAGGPPTFLYRARWSPKIAEVTWPGGGRFAARYSYGFNLGYYTRALAGFTLNYGASASDFDDLGQVGGGSTVLKPYRTSPGINEEWLTPLRASPKGFALWLDYELSAFAYNQLLEGAWFGRNNVTFDNSQIRRVVHKIGVGAEITFLSMWLGVNRDADTRVYWMQSFRSEDLKGPAGRRHYWGGLYLTRKLGTNEPR